MTPWSAPTTPAGPSRGSTTCSCKAPAAIVAGREAGRPVKRLLVVGGAGSLFVATGACSWWTPRPSPAEYKQGALAAREALNRLKLETSLDWTFLSPPIILAPGVRTGQYRTGLDQPLPGEGEAPSGISVADLAVAIVDEIETRATCSSASRWRTEAAQGSAEAGLRYRGAVFGLFQAFLAVPQREMVFSSYEFDTESESLADLSPLPGSRVHVDIARRAQQGGAQRLLPVLRHGVDIGRAHRQQLARIDHPAARAQGDALAPAR
jgi:hypothetical protein